MTWPSQGVVAPPRPIGRDSSPRTTSRTRTTSNATKRPVLAGASCEAHFLDVEVGAGAKQADLGAGATRMRRSGLLRGIYTCTTITLEYGFQPQRRQALLTRWARTGCPLRG